MIAAITGANGFIGAHLMRRFADAGWKTRPIVRGDFESGHVDEMVHGADVVVHAAGATRASTVTRLRASNVALTERILDASSEAGVPRFIFISSQAATGPARVLESPVTEETPATPIEAYGETKLAAEAIVRARSGVETVIVRPASVYGPGDRDFLALFRVAQHGVAIHPANRDHWLSIIHVSDLAWGVVRCAQSPGAAGQTYFLANDEPVQWATLFRLGAESAERALRLEVTIPAAVLAMGAKLGDIAALVTGHSSLLTTRKLALSAATFWVCSSDKACRELSFAARIELKRGLSDTYAWYRAHQWL